MNKASLLTVGKKLSDGNLYMISVYDLEPSGVVVHAYDQTNSKEYHFPVTEFEVILLHFFWFVLFRFDLMKCTNVFMYDSLLVVDIPEDKPL